MFRVFGIIRWYPSQDTDRRDSLRLRLIMTDSWLRHCSQPHRAVCDVCDQHCQQCQHGA